jgi:hypothetical protein
MQKRVSMGNPDDLGRIGLNLNPHLNQGIGA